MVCGSGVLVAIAWVINSMADSLFLARHEFAHGSAR
jgi:hypothetical protein